MGGKGKRVYHTKCVHYKSNKVRTISRVAQTKFLDLVQIPQACPTQLDSLEVVRKQSYMHTMCGITTSPKE